MPTQGDCTACTYEQAHGFKFDTSSLSRQASISGVSRFAISRHLKHAPGYSSALPKLAEPVKGASESREEGSDGSIRITKVSDRIIPLSEWLDDLREDGHDPDDFNTSHGHSVWGQNSRKAGEVTLYANKFSAVQKNKAKVGASVLDSIDPVGILAQLRAIRSTRSGPFSLDYDAAESAFCISINDIQLGQSYNGGSPATIATFYEFIEMAKGRIIELRKINRRLETLVVVCGGDLVEGCVIYGNQAFSLDLNRKEQVQGVVALLLHALDSLAPLFETVKVLACMGNHGENRIDGKYTTLSDNDDTLCVEMAKLALSRDASMQHIEWVIAVEQAGVTIDVYDWVLATTHGDIYAKGVQGATIDKKAHSWYKNMAGGRRRFGKLGLADVLIGHHFHHDKMSDWGACFFRQTPSQDRGSPYFENASGEYSEPGMLSWVMTPGKRYTDELVLRLDTPILPV